MMTFSLSNAPDAMKTKNKTVEYEVQVCDSVFGWEVVAGNFPRIEQAREDARRLKAAVKWPKVRFRIVKVTKEVVK